MVLLHAGPGPSHLVAFALLTVLACVILVTASIISELQREEQPPAAKRKLSQRSRSRDPRAER